MWRNDRTTDISTTIAGDGPGDGPGDARNLAEANRPVEPELGRQADRRIDRKTDQRIDRKVGQKIDRKVERATTGLTPYGMSLWALILAACGGGGGGGGGGGPTTSGPAAAPAETPTDTPTDTPADTPTKAPTDTPADTQTGTPADTQTGTPANTPANTPPDTPRDTPPDTPAAPSESQASGRFLHRWTTSTRKHASYAINENTSIVVSLEDLWNDLEIEDDPPSDIIAILFDSSGVTDNEGSASPHYRDNRDLARLKVETVNGKKHLVFVDGEGDRVTSDFESADDITGNKVYFIHISMGGVSYGVNISVQNVDEGEDSTSTFTEMFMSEDGARKSGVTTGNVEIPTNESNTASVGSFTVDASKPHDTSVLQSLKVETIRALFNIPEIDTPDMTVLSGDRLMLEFNDGGGMRVRYVISLEMYVERRGTMESAGFVSVEFADKGEDSTGNEIVDLQFTRGERLTNNQNFEGEKTYHFSLKAEKLATDGSVDASWSPPQKLFVVTVAANSNRPDPEQKASGQGDGEVLTEVLRDEDFLPNAGMEELGTPPAEML